MIKERFDFNKIFSKIMASDKDIIFTTDTGFELGLNTLYKEIINKFYSEINDPNDYNILMHTINVMEDEEKFKIEKFKIEK